MLGIEILINRRKSAVTCKWCIILLLDANLPRLLQSFQTFGKTALLRIIIAILIITDIDLSIIPIFIFEALGFKAKYYTRFSVFLILLPCYFIIIFTSRIIYNILKRLLIFYYTYNINFVCFFIYKTFNNF